MQLAMPFQVAFSMFHCVALTTLVDEKKVDSMLHKEGAWCHILDSQAGLAKWLDAGKKLAVFKIKHIMAAVHTYQLNRNTQRLANNWQPILILAREAFQFEKRQVSAAVQQ